MQLPSASRPLGLLILSLILLLAILSPAVAATPTTPQTSPDRRFALAEPYTLASTAEKLTTFFKRATKIDPPKRKGGTSGGTKTTTTGKKRTGMHGYGGKRSGAGSVVASGALAVGVGVVAGLAMA